MTDDFSLFDALDSDFAAPADAQPDWVDVGEDRYAGLDDDATPAEDDGSGPSEYACDEADAPVWAALALEPVELNVVVGDPEAATPWWDIQHGPASCAVATQAQVIRSIGMDVTEEELAELAEERGWFDPAAGTPPDFCGRLLTDRGIPNSNGFFWQLDDLGTALARNERVLLTVNSNDYVCPDESPDLPPSFHSIWLTGFGESADGSRFAVVNDPGVPGGAAMAMPLELLQSAWGEASNHAVITRLGGAG